MRDETIHIRKAGGSIEMWCGLTLTEKPPNCIKWGSPYEGNCEACIEAFSAALVESIRNA